MADPPTTTKRVAAATDRKKKRRKTGTTTDDNAANTRTSGSSKDHPPTPLRRCAQCQEEKLPSDFSVRQRKKCDHAKIKCRTCTRVENENDSCHTKTTRTAKLHTCRGCHRPKHPLKSFDPQELATKGLLAKCHDCVKMALEQTRRKQATKRCSQCNQVSGLANFSKSSSKDDGNDDEHAMCNSCWTENQIPKKECRRCHQKLPLRFFTGRERMKEFVGVCYGCLAIILQVPTRRCSMCHTHKERAFFPDYQCWDNCCATRNITCLDCRSIAQRRSEAWYFAKAGAVSMWKQMGAVAYKLPLTRPQLHASCGTEKPAVDLEGTYKVIFHRAKCPEFCFQQQRTNKGTLTLTLSSAKVKLLANENHNVIVEGKIEFESEGSAVCPFGSNYNIVSKHCSYDGITPWRLDFELEKLKGQLASLADHFVAGMGAELRVIAKRIALPWQPTEDFDHRENHFIHPCQRTEDYIRDRLSFGRDKLVEFETNEEAEALLQRHESWRSGKTSWIANHLPFSSDIAKHIHEYCSWCPPPVLFLEPGDLVLTTLLTPLSGRVAFSDLVVRKIV